MKILLDASVLIHCEFAEPAEMVEEVLWGPTIQKVKIHGYRRKALDPNPDHQREKDALFSIGRLIREGKITAYRYDEVMVEVGRVGGASVVNALAGCKLQWCKPAIERSKFLQTIDREDQDKGGRKDRAAGRIDCGFSQIAAFTKFKNYTPQMVDQLVDHAELIGLSPFEIESLRDLRWFQFVSDRSASAENFPDVFHLWTAERHGFSLLTLETRLGKLVGRIQSERKQKVEIKTRVFRPTELLTFLNVTQLDPVPLEPDRFYHFR